MKLTMKVFGAIIAALCVYSLIPVTLLYIQKSPAPYTNKEAAEKLKGNGGEYFAFIVFGDNHAGLIFDDSNTLKLVSSMNREGRFRKIPIDLVLNVGDVTLMGSRWDYTIYNKIRAKIKWPVISSIGNHDDDRHDLRLFEKYIGSDEISFSDRNSYFIILNNIRNDLTAEQFSRFEEALKASQGYSHRFVIVHKGPFSPYQQSWYRPEITPWSYRFMKLCEKYKVDIVFSGHEHMFKKQEFGGVKYMTSGGGGGFSLIPSESGGYLNYMVVRVYGDYVDYEVRRIFPPFWEFVTYYVWKDIFYLIKSII